MSHTLEVCRVVPMYRQVVLCKSHVVKFMKSSLSEVEKPYRKSDYNHRKWFYVNGRWKCRGVVTTRHELTRLVSSKSRLDLWLENRLQTKEIKQEAMQCIPRSRNVCGQRIRFKEMRVQETKLCI